MVIGIDENRFWELTPKTIRIYFKAYEEKQKNKIRDMWQMGSYVACAIASIPTFGRKAIKYPNMPFENEYKEQLSQDENWVKQERQRAYNHFMIILGGKSKK